jgi:hypothetical protein
LALKSEAILGKAVAIIVPSKLAKNVAIANLCRTTRIKNIGRDVKKTCREKEE